MRDYSDKGPWMQQSPVGLKTQTREKQLLPTDIYIGHLKRKINTAKIERLILAVMKYALVVPGAPFIFLETESP